jgi:GNAT superfamily N-acetyltransferase
MSIEVLPATGRWDDFAEMLVPKKPGAGGCICMSYRDARLDTMARVAHMRDECSREPGPGVLLYEDDEVAGWASVAPRSTYRRLMNSRTIPHVDERDPWSIVCFVVRAGHRRRGLMHELLDGAVAHARAHGAEVVEGYPADTRGERIDVISGYVGTVELFEQHGFERVVLTTAHAGHRERWLMRRELGDSARHPDASGASKHS